MTLEATNLTDSDKSDWLDWYNTYSGVLGSLVSLPLQKFATTLLPLFLLFVSSKGLLPMGRLAVISNYGPLLVLMGILWHLDQGMSALNVQFDSPVVDFIISPDDLEPALDDTNFPFNMTVITNSAQIAGISSLDTILRTAIRKRSQQRKHLAQVTCTLTIPHCLRYNLGSQWFLGLEDCCPTQSPVEISCFHSP